jgi:hypothetical protein
MLHLILAESVFFVALLCTPGNPAEVEALIAKGRQD